jgi:hypothetical protein
MGRPKGTEALPVALKRLAETAAAYGLRAFHQVEHRNAVLPLLQAADEYTRVILVQAGLLSDAPPPARRKRRAKRKLKAFNVSCAKCGRVFYNASNRNRHQKTCKVK